MLSFLISFFFKIVFNIMLLGFILQLIVSFFPENTFISLYSFERFLKNQNLSKNKNIKKSLYNSFTEKINYFRFYIKYNINSFPEIFLGQLFRIDDQNSINKYLFIMNQLSFQNVSGIYFVDVQGISSSSFNLFKESSYREFDILMIFNYFLSNDKISINTKRRTVYILEKIVISLTSLNEEQSNLLKKFFMDQNVSRFTSRDFVVWLINKGSNSSYSGSSSYFQDPNTTMSLREIYSILEIKGDNITDIEVKNAYRRAMRKYHPDKNACNDSSSSSNDYQYKLKKAQIVQSAFQTWKKYYAKK